jgi:hypothetical protein
MKIRRRKSRAQQVSDALTTYVKLKAVSKAAKGAGKAAKGTAAYQVAKRNRIVQGIPVVAGVAVATFVAVRRRKGGGEAAPVAA